MMEGDGFGGSLSGFTTGEALEGDFFEECKYGRCFVFLGVFMLSSRVGTWYYSYVYMA
jgi:hypothetical protein